MLRMMSRSVKKDQDSGNQESFENRYGSDFIGPKQKTNSLFNSIPGLLVRFGPKGSLDCDSIYSPTSPLDFRVFSKLTNPFRSPKSPHDCHHKHFKCSKVGLSIIESLSDDVEDGKKGSGSDLINQPLDCKKNIVVGTRMRIKSSNYGSPFDFLEKPMSLPKDYGIIKNAHIKLSNLRKEQGSDSLFEIGEDPFEHELIGNALSCSLDSGRRFSTCNSFDYLNKSSVRTTTQAYSPLSIGKRSKFENFFPANMSSNSAYTGSPRAFTGRPFGSEVDLFDGHHRLYQCSESPGLFRSVSFLSFCYSCKTKLDGEDIYMYRGEKAFCSLTCREQEILNDVELDEEDTLDDLPDTTPAADQDG